MAPPPVWTSPQRVNPVALSSCPHPAYPYLQGANAGDRETEAGTWDTVVGGGPSRGSGGGGVKPESQQMGGTSGAKVSPPTPTFLLWPLYISHGSGFRPDAPRHIRSSLVQASGSGMNRWCGKQLWRCLGLGVASVRHRTSC